LIAIACWVLANAPTTAGADVDDDTEEIIPPHQPKPSQGKHKMACEAEQDRLDRAIALASKEMEADLARIAADVKTRSAKLESEFESGQDLGEGIGATVGTAIGAILGGPGGGAAGGVVGQQVGKLLVVEIREKLVRISTEVPTITSRTKDIIISVPQVAVQKNDIRFSKPEVVMVRHRGPNVPSGLECKRFKCTVRYKKTWVSRPEIRMVEHRIVIGVPRVTMRPKSISTSVPEVAMRRREVVFSVPQVTLRFVRDAGRRLASAAGGITRDAELASADVEAKFRARLKMEASLPLISLTDCHKSGLKLQMDETAREIDAEITRISDSLTGMIARGVPETNDDYLAAKNALDRTTQSRVVAVKPWQDAMDALDREAAAALEEFAKA